MRNVLFTVTTLSITFLALSGLSFGESSPEQDTLAVDQVACQEHAKMSVGSVASAPAAAVAQPRRGVGLRGAARGAARGAIVGGTVEAIGDDRRNDATEMGAALGAFAGGARARRAAQAAPVQPAAPAIDPSAYTAIYNECMTSRGHAVQ